MVADVDLFEQGKTAVREIGEMFQDPWDDWESVMFIRCHDGAVMPAIVPMHEGTSKNAVADAVMQTLKRLGATEAVWIQSCWTVAYDPEVKKYDARTELPPAEHPDRRECVMVTHVSKEATEIASAYIERFVDRPPELGSWTVMVDEGKVPVGRFVTAMQRGIA